MKSILICISLLFVLPLPLVAQVIGTPPVLMEPIQGEVVDARKPICFRWTMVSPANGFFQNSELRIVEVLPGQAVAQAIRSNMPLISRNIVGMTQTYLSAMDIPIQPNDSMHLAWWIFPNSPSGLMLQPNGAASEPEDFWLTDGLHRRIAQLNEPPISDCGLVDAGRDQVIKAHKPGPVQLGAKPDDNYRYEWFSDPRGYHAYQSHVLVNPAQTTRYLLMRTDSATGCQVFDEVWVEVEAPFDVHLEVDQCGTIRAVVTTPPAAGPGNVPEVQGLPMPTPLGPNEPILPPSRSRLPPSLMKYSWSNGSHETTITPQAGAGKDYAVTVSNGIHEVVRKITLDQAPNNNFKGDFPVLAVPKNVKLGDKAFKIYHYGYASSQPAYNATSYRLTVVCVDSPQYVRIIEGYTTTGFADGEIAWDEAAVGDVAAIPGKYRWFLSLRNCDYPVHELFRPHRIRKIQGTSNPSHCGPAKWMFSGKFKVINEI
jgi:hypothetical protein